jgi:hypothetical protein
MNSFQERSWNPKYDFGYKSKRKTPNRKTGIQIEEQVIKYVKQKIHERQLRRKLEKTKPRLAWLLDIPCKSGNVLRN